MGKSFAEVNKTLLNMAFDKRLNVMFNITMTDSELIESLGGPTKVAEILNFDKQGGVQRVQNWLSRGIPAQVKVDHPEIFLTELRRDAAVLPADLPKIAPPPDKEKPDKPHPKKPSTALQEG